MRIPAERTNRLGIFFFFDPAGVVDSYVTVLLEDMTKSFTDFTIVVNGKLNDAGRKVFERFTSKIIVRENEGLDVWAYKTALDSYGWAKLEEFDEVVLFNATIMGPVYPFSEMFAEMSERDIDFWGINWYHQYDADPFGTIREGYIPRHIQSHFHAYRRSLVTSVSFQKYWSSIPKIHSYTESVGIHEAPFTQRFERLGFVSDVYINTEEYEGRSNYPLLFYPQELIEKKRCPVFKRRSFFHNYFDTITQSVGEATPKLYAYLRDHTDYDTDLIWENALRTMHMADVQRALKLTYVFPSETGVHDPRPQRIALVAHLYYMDLLDSMIEYICSMPEGCDVILTTVSPQKLEKIREATRDLPYRVDVRLIENRGRDVSALLVGARDVMDYDLVCFIHDKKVTQLSPYSKGDGFALKCLDNLLASREFVSNVIAEFEREPRLGMLMPPPPNHAEYFPGYSLSWGPNYDATVKLLKKLDINVPISADKEPVSPLGTMFWFRPNALAPLFAKQWEFEDFPREPNATDGTILHAVERAYGYSAQAAGYFCAWLLSDRFARIELTNLTFELQELTKAVAYSVPRAPLVQMVAMISSRLPVLAKFKHAVHRHAPQSLQAPLGSVYRGVRAIYRRIR